MLPTLVMLHGSNGSGETLLPLADLLRPHARIETPNLIGHGGRSVPERFSVRDFAEDVVAYLDAQKLARAYCSATALAAISPLHCPPLSAARRRHLSARRQVCIRREHCQALHVYCRSGANSGQGDACSRTHQDPSSSGAGRRSRVITGSCSSNSVRARADRRRSACLVGAGPCHFGR